MRRLLIMRYDAKKIRAVWANQKMAVLSSEDQEQDSAAEMAMAFAITATQAVEAATAADEAIAASKQRLDSLVTETNVRIDAAKEEGDSDIADALRASLELEIEFHRQQAAVWVQWKEQQEKAAAEANPKTQGSAGAGAGAVAKTAGGGGGAPTKPQRAPSAMDEECPMCLDPFEDPFKTHCGHVFCKECVQKWVADTPTCPMCRAELPPVV
jgi:hypothetical protein